MGDLKNAIKKLHSTSKTVRFDFGSNLKELSTGTPTHYLTLYHYLFLNYSHLLAGEILEKHQIELQNKTDKAFMEGIYKLLRDMFDYAPKLTQTQFFSTSYAQVKAQMACEIISLVQQKVKLLNTTTNSITSSGSSTTKSLHSLAQHTSTVVASTQVASTLVSSSGANSNIASTGNPQPSSSGLFRSASLRSSSSMSLKRPSSKTPMAVHNHLAQTTHETRKQDSTPIATINETALTISNQNLKIEKLENELTNVKNQLQLVESKMETLIRQNEALLLAQHQFQSQSQPSKPTQNSINSNIAQINKTDLENLLSRLTIVETEILVRKQQCSKGSRVEDQNETTFHSFLNTSSDMNNSVIAMDTTLGGAGSAFIQRSTFNEPPMFKSRIMCQGVPVDFNVIDDNSINSNDSTPTMCNVTSKESKFKLNTNTNNTNMTETSNISKAKDAVLRAHLFCNDLAKINQQSKA